MTSTSRIRYALFCILAIPVVLGCGDERIASPTGERQKRIERLINSLASQPEWVMPKGSKTRVPYRGFKSTDKDRVMDAAEAIVKEGVAAFPQLAEQADDNRYSFTCLGGN